MSYRGHVLWEGRSYESTFLMGGHVLQEDVSYTRTCHIGGCLAGGHMLLEACLKGVHVLQEDVSYMRHVLREDMS